MISSDTRSDSPELAESIEGQRGYSILIALFSFAIALSSFRIMGVSVFSGIDGSFEWALNMLSCMNLKFGIDIASTFGPLGFLSQPMFPAGNILSANLISLILSVLTGLASFALMRRLKSLKKSFLYLLLLYSAFWLCRTATLDYRVISAFLPCLSAAFLTSNKIARLAFFLAASILAALVLFIKFNIGMLCCSSLLLAAALSLLPGNRRVFASAIAGLLIFLALVSSMSVYFFGSLGGFFSFMKRCGQIAAPYSQSMSSFAQPDLQLYSAILVILIAATSALVATIKRSSFSVPLILSGIPLLLSFKHAFIRVDNLFNFPFIALLVVAVSLPFAEKKVEKLSLLVIVIALCPFLPARLGANPIEALCEQPLSLGFRSLTNFASLTSYEARLDKQTALNYKEGAIPEAWLSMMKRAENGVDCIPFNSFLVPANNLKWCPPPVTQLYIAHHPELDQWTAEHFSGGKKPDFLISEFPDCDWRHPFFTCPLSWRAIYRNYETLELSKNSQLLLKPRKKPLQENLKLLSSLDFAAAQWVMLPPEHAYLIGKIKMEKTRIGFLRELLYRTDPVYIDLLYENGSFGHFRMVPLQADSGVMLSQMPRTIEGMRDLFANKASEKVRAFMLSGPGLKSFQKRLKVEFWDAEYN
ncbi:MAG: hypothetical protein K2X27_06870 [Candidatus Obscuribacterales bacterium]|nr:hypothetical protein [Candidatus Obscuribacterales bacterium]